MNREGHAVALITGDSTTDQRVAVLNRYYDERKMRRRGRERKRGKREGERERERREREREREWGGGPGG